VPRGAAALRDRAKADTTQAAAAEPVEAETVDPGASESTREPDSAAAPKPDNARRKWLNRMFQLLTEAQCTDRDYQLTVIRNLAEAAWLEHRDAVTDDQLKAVVNQLNQWDKAGQLVEKVADILDQAAIDAAQAATSGAHLEYVVDSAYGPGARGEVNAAARQAISAVLGQPIGLISVWEGQPGRTQQDVENILEKAITGVTA
jgi:hypothetical protein